MQHGRRFGIKNYNNDMHKKFDLNPLTFVTLVSFSCQRTGIELE